MKAGNQVYTKQVARKWIAKESVDRSVNCYFCSALSYDSECIPADAYNDNDGGSICPKCLDGKSPQ